MYEVSTLSHNADQPRATLQGYLININTENYPGRVCGDLPVELQRC